MGVRDFLYELKSGKYPGLEIREHNAKSEMELYNRLLAAYNVSESECGKVPLVYVGDVYCVGEKDCFKKIEPGIDECGSGGCACSEPKQRSAPRWGLSA